MKRYSFLVLVVSVIGEVRSNFRQSPERRNFQVHEDLSFEHVYF